jgi:hypothetical protein
MIVITSVVFGKRTAWDDPELAQLLENAEDFLALITTSRRKYSGWLTVTSCYSSGSRETRRGLDARRRTESKAQVCIPVTG